MRKHFLRALAAIALLTAAAPIQNAPFNKTRATFKSGPNTLVGFSYHPDGPGPFPTVIWNHGSEKDPAGGPQFDSVAKVFVPALIRSRVSIRVGSARSPFTSNSWMSSPLILKTARAGSSPAG